MRILVYGAGVQGCQLAHSLAQNKKNVVTLLARGEWKEVIDQKGLTIRHMLQRKTTVDRMQTTDVLAPEDVYDLVFVTVQAGQLDEAQLRRDQKLLLDYARMAVTEENVDILARQALAARPRVAASTLADEYPGDFARIIGLHTYSQSPRRCYDIRLTGEWTQRGGFRFEEFILTPRKEEAEDDRNE